MEKSHYNPIERWDALYMNLSDSSGCVPNICGDKDPEVAFHRSLQPREAVALSTQPAADAGSAAAACYEPHGGHKPSFFSGDALRLVIEL